jgi:NAD(P)-dependent dehydrogenase (short-subunit alcohol dehydrogenase family)
LPASALEPRLRRPDASIVNVSSIALAGGGDSDSEAKAAISQAASTRTATPSSLARSVESSTSSQISENC